MRNAAYYLFGLVAWPAAAWGAFETALRIATWNTDGLPAVVLLTACAAATVAAARWRAAALDQARGLRTED